MCKLLLSRDVSCDPILDIFTGKNLKKLFKPKHLSDLTDCRLFWLYKPLKTAL